jgi:hypothetical protein
LWSYKLSGSKITLFIATLVVGLVTSNFVPYQQSWAQAQNNSTNTMSMSMMPDSTLSPENETASIGDLILTTFDSSAG